MISLRVVLGRELLHHLQLIHSVSGNQIEPVHLLESVVANEHRHLRHHLPDPGFPEQSGEHLFVDGLVPQSTQRIMGGIRQRHDQTIDLIELGRREVAQRALELNWHTADWARTTGNALASPGNWQQRSSPTPMPQSPFVRPCPPNRHHVSTGECGQANPAPFPLVNTPSPVSPHIRQSSFVCPQPEPASCLGSIVSGSAAGLQPPGWNHVAARLSTRRQVTSVAGRSVAPHSGRVAAEHGGTRRSPCETARRLGGRGDGRSGVGRGRGRWCRRSGGSGFWRERGRGRGGRRGCNSSFG